jgi:hypothetical protein
MGGLTILRLTMVFATSHFAHVNEHFVARGGYLRAYLAGYLLTLDPGSPRA